MNFLLPLFVHMRYNALMGIVSYMAHHARAFVLQERGATAIEYALIASLVSIFIIAALLVLSENVVGLFDTVADEVRDAGRT